MKCMFTDNFSTLLRKLTLAQYSDVGDECSIMAKVMIDFVSQMMYNLKCLYVVKCSKTGRAPEPEHIYKIKKV
jgi:hypothetical protein